MNSTFETIFLVAGGLGLFLFGMKIMSNGIEIAAGDRLQHILQKATSNRVLGVIVGILATIVINSSTATTIMTVSFVNSGLMNLTQAMGIILGANVGTTFSAQLIAFRIDTVAPLFIFIGIIMHLFLKKKSHKNVGYIILGFGILFFGVSVMGGPLTGLRHDPSFVAILTTFENPILAVLAGFVFTAVVQSSSASMGILVTMHLSGVPISFETSAYIILGTNIGTSITTVLASIPASRESKRAALFHIMFDIIGTTVFGTLIFVFPGILNWFTSTWTESARQVAMFHTLYNFATLFLILPFVGQVARLMEKIVPVKESAADTPYEKKLIYLDTQIVDTPSVVVQNAHLELCRMLKIAEEELSLALEAFFETDIEKANKIFKIEKTINYLSRKISAKLVKINSTALSPTDAKKLGKMFRILYDIERIGDHAENIAEYAVLVRESDLTFPTDALEELKILGTAVTRLVAKVYATYEKSDASQKQAIKAMEAEVDRLALEFTGNHIERLKAESFEPRSGVVFTDMIIDLERSADHANNISASMQSRRKRRKKTRVAVK